MLAKVFGINRNKRSQSPKYAIGGHISQDAFLTGYAAAQAVPGPMFTFATFVGYTMTPDFPLAGALTATLAVFLPGFLLLTSALKTWHALRSNTWISGALNGVNAAVVGLLITVAYTPVFSSSVLTPTDMALVIAGLTLYHVWRLPVLALVVFFVFSSMALTLI